MLKGRDEILFSDKEVYDQSLFRGYDQSFSRRKILGSGFVDSRTGFFLSNIG